jgi:hypothetical protein
MNHPEFQALRPPLPALLTGLLLLLSSIVLATPTETPPDIESTMTAGADAVRRGQFDQAARHWQTASRAQARAGDPTRQLDALLLLVDAHVALGRSRDALDTARAAQMLAEPLDDPARHAAALGALGKAEWLTGATEDARRSLERGIALARQTGNSTVAAASLNQLGNLFLEQGDLPAARVAYQDSLSLARQAQDEALIVTVLVNAARLAHREGDVRRAEALLAEAGRQMQTLPDSHAKTLHLLASGQLRRELPGAAAAQRQQAAQDFAAAAAMARRLGDRRGLSYALGYQAQLRQEAGYPIEALALHRQAAFAAQQADAPELLYRWQWRIGRLLNTQGDRDGAILAYQQAAANLQLIRPDFTASRTSSGGSFRAQVGDAFLELADLLLQRAAQQSSASAREADLLAARDTMEALKTAEVRDYFQDECVTALQARTVALDRPPPRTAILYPILLADRLVLLLNTARGIEQIVVSVDPETLVPAVREFRHYLEKRTTREYLPFAQRLHGWLIQPLQNALDAQRVDTLVIVPDGPCGPFRWRPCTTARNS